MIRPSKRTENVEYAIRDIAVLAKDVEAQGRDMIWCNIGDPCKFDFKTPEFMIDAAYVAMLRGHNGYAPSHGIEEARIAIEKSVTREGIKNIQELAVTQGGSEGIAISLSALLDPGDNVLTPYPGYPFYGATINTLMAEENPYHLDEENGWQPDIEDIRSKINGRTRAIVIINPNNPTGSVYPKEVLQEIISISKEHDIIIISDEIYSQILFDKTEHVPTASLDDEACIVTINGASKAFLVPGWRLGWMTISGVKEHVAEYIEANNKLLRARLCANYPQQFSIKPALKNGNGHLKEMNSKLQRRRDVVMDGLSKIQDISCVEPKGAFYAFPQIHHDGLNDKKWVEGLIRETGLVLVHGGGFGEKPDTSHFRIVLLPEEKTLDEACKIIKKYMEKGLH